MAGTHRPKVSFVLYAYMQEAFVEEAVLAAFAQSCEPLQIILSDDCSTDRTGEIMERLAKDYVGPHEVIVNRNPVNLHIGDHVNTVLRQCSGEWIVAAAGDDVSAPARVERTMEAVRKTPGVMLLNTDFSEIDEEGRELSAKSGRDGLRLITSHREFVRKTPAFMGATAAFHRDVYFRFGPMMKGAIYEDRVLAYRAWLLGKLQMVDEVLVARRIHDANLTSTGNWHDRAAALAQHYSDLLCAMRLGLDLPEEARGMRRELLKAMDDFSCLAQEGGNPLRRQWARSRIEPRYFRRKLRGLLGRKSAGA